MRSLPRRTLLYFILGAAISLASARAGNELGSAEPFKSGDTVCYVGDSITEDGGYHALIDLFYATRYPDRGLQTYNCGIAQDRAADILGNAKFRLAGDIMGHGPTVATIMLGMNDIGHADYGTEKKGREFERRRAASLKAYDASMKELIATLQKSGVRVILLTPSIYDETTELSSATPSVGLGRNAALSQCARQMGEWAILYHTGLVRINETMNAITAREQAKDPAFTLIGPDRIHPGAVGHFVMAYVFLRAQNVSPEVARIAVDARLGRPADAERCAIEQVVTGPQGVEFDCLEGGLPFVPPPEAKAALALVPFQQELNREVLKVEGLSGGRYALMIDGQVVGDYGDAELADGIDLAGNPKTPQYVQSAAATKLSAERARAAQMVREEVRKKYRALPHPGAADLSAFGRMFLGVSDGAKEFIRDWRQADRESALRAATAELVRACQPRRHHFALVRL